MNTTLYILIVDDSDIMQEILSAALKSLGHRGVIVGNVAYRLWAWLRHDRFAGVEVQERVQEQDQNKAAKM